MRTTLLATALLASLVLTAPSAHASLIEYVYHNIPTTTYIPTDASIAATQANAAAVSPNYSFINSADTFKYTSTSTQTNTYLGVDAAGAALTDTSTTGQTAFDAKGFINISTSGSYTFSFANADDAARVYVAGALVAEQNFPGFGLSTPSSATISLSAGSYAFELFYYQQTGGSNLSYLVSGVGAVTYSVREPSTIGLLAVAVMVLAGVALRRSREG